MTNYADLVAEGIDLENMGHYTQAIEMMEPVIAGAEDTDLIAIAHNWTGIARRGLRDFHGAMRDYQESINPRNDTSINGWAYVNMADIQRVGIYDYPKAHTLLDKAHNLTAGGSFVDFLEPDQRGLVLVSQEKYGAAVAAYLHAMEHAELLSNGELSEPHPELLPQARKKLGQIYQHLGAVYQRLGNYEDAMKWHTSGLEIAEELGDVMGSMNCAVSLSALAEASGDIDYVIELLSPMMERMLATDSRSSACYVGLHLASLHTANNETEKAAKYMNRFLAGVENGTVTKHDLSILQPSIRDIL